MAARSAFTLSDCKTAVPERRSLSSKRVRVTRSRSGGTSSLRSRPWRRSLPTIGRGLAPPSGTMPLPRLAMWHCSPLLVSVADRMSREMSPAASRRSGPHLRRRGSSDCAADGVTSAILDRPGRGRRRPADHRGRTKLQEKDTPPAAAVSTVFMRSLRLTAAHESSDKPHERRGDCVRGDALQPVANSTRGA